MTQLSEETQTIITITRHISIVRRCLLALATELIRRANDHDLSKFSEDEFAGFVQINQAARQHKYGTPEYRAALRSVKPNPVKLHYSRNSHHPDHYPGGVSDMSLPDLIEMTADWLAAAETYGQTSFEESLPINIDRFHLTPEQAHLIKLAADCMVDN